jgi:hypothetical protein
MKTFISPHLLPSFQSIVAVEVESPDFCLSHSSAGFLIIPIRCILNVTAVAYAAFKRHVCIASRSGLSEKL